MQQWLSGKARDKIAADNNIGSGTVTSVIDNYKIGLDNLDFGSFRDSFRELMVEAKKQGLTPSDLAILLTVLAYMSVVHLGGTQ